MINAAKLKGINLNLTACRNSNYLLRRRTPPKSCVVFSFFRKLFWFSEKCGL